MNNDISPNIFRAYDIRGVYNKDISAPIMYKIGLAFGTYVKNTLKGREVVVGNEIRQSSFPLVHSFISGVTATGIDIIYVGTTAFGQTLYAGWFLKKTATAFVTASHLPPEWNGIKFYHSDGVGFSEEELMSIRDIAIDEKYSVVDWKDIGSSNSYNIKTEYENFFKRKFKFTEKLKVAIDCGGGSTTLSVPEIFTSLGIEITRIYCDTDPTFSGRPSDPKPKNLTELVKAIPKHGCNFGVAFDGDGDRAVIVDELGRILSADQTGIIIGMYGLKNKQGTIIANVECSKSVAEQLEPLGFKVKQIPVGHTFLTIEAKEEKSPLGVESSGHIILPEYFLFDDAIVTPLKIAEILNREKRELSTLVDEIPSYPIRKEEIPCEDDLKFTVVDLLKQKLLSKFEDVNTMDGVRINFQEGWVLIRPSNTSPIIRMTIEADDEVTIEKLSEEFKTQLMETISEIQSRR
ncbi:MAG: Phosphomannomutase/phosphoglucomutase [Candidatus Heimdallarchaeota archaeon AB_125]|nr:MAG: Phosphomannomutase/phosphoglucomutase [Candidatus Heimdallarchaeota archaeon AB_125]